eukprot:357778-Chlamydomonas_euryale.AAC.9
MLCVSPCGRAVAVAAPRGPVLLFSAPTGAAADVAAARVCALPSPWWQQPSFPDALRGALLGVAPALYAGEDLKVDEPLSPQRIHVAGADAPAAVPQQQAQAQHGGQQQVQQQQQQEMPPEQQQAPEQQQHPEGQQHGQQQQQQLPDQQLPDQQQQQPAGLDAAGDDHAAGLDGNVAMEENGADGGGGGGGGEDVLGPMHGAVGPLQGAWPLEDGPPGGDMDLEAPPAAVGEPGGDEAPPPAAALDEAPDAVMDIQPPLVGEPDGGEAPPPAAALDEALDAAVGIQPAEVGQVPPPVPEGVGLGVDLGPQVPPSNPQDPPSGVGGVGMLLDMRFLSRRDSGSGDSNDAGGESDGTGGGNNGRRSPLRLALLLRREGHVDGEVLMLEEGSPPASVGDDGCSTAPLDSEDAAHAVPSAGRRAAQQLQLPVGPAAAPVADAGEAASRSALRAAQRLQLPAELASLIGAPCRIQPCPSFDSALMLVGPRGALLVDWTLAEAAAACASAQPRPHAGEVAASDAHVRPGG